MILDVAYMVIIRFLLLDTMLYTFSHSRHPAHTTLIRIVMLYLEITVVTILYFALVFYLFDVFTLFHFNALLSAQNLESIKNHPFISSFYIYAITFTTLGSGEWVPQNIHAMLAVSSEVIWV